MPTELEYPKHQLLIKELNYKSYYLCNCYLNICSRVQHSILHNRPMPLYWYKRVDDI